MAGSALSTVAVDGLGSTATPIDTSRAAARRLLDRWMAAPEPRRSADALSWAVLLQDWQALTEIWVTCSRVVGFGSNAGLTDVFSQLPNEARKASPLLTWPWALARAETLSSDPSVREGIVMMSLLSDAVTLHSNWRQATTTDGAVAAGTFWMLGQRAMPGTPQIGGLDNAWTTQNDVAAYVGEQRRVGRPPMNLTAAIFRAASAQLALARAELDQALAESSFAVALEPRLGGLLVGGTRRLALILAGSSDYAEAQAGSIVGPEHDEPAWFQHGLATQDVICGLMADALAALAVLDRDGCRRALDSLGDFPRGAAQWTTASFLRGLYAALWGDAGAGLVALDAAISRHGTASVEHREPLGEALLRRARIALLDRLGATDAALGGGTKLPESWRWVPRSRSLLWSGDFQGAARAADTGIFEPTTRLPDRRSLLVAKAASLAVELPSSPATTAAVIQSVRDCLEAEAFLPLGLLPAGARDALLEHYRAACGSAGAPPLPARLTDSLDRLVRLGELKGADIALTRRERVLLPLLASDETVTEIASGLQVSPNTLRKQVVKLRSKFDARSRTELVWKARHAGLL